MRIAAFTICAKNYLPYARTLMRSLACHQRDVHRITLIADAPDDSLGSEVDLGRVLFACELNLPDFEHFAFRYDVTEFNTAIKPYAIRQLLDEGFDAVLYIDPDIKLFAPLEEVLVSLSQGWDAVLTPHLLSPVVDTEEPNDLTILRTGTFNLGFAAFAGSAQVRDFLDWWCLRLERQCLFNQLDKGIFVDQKWIDLLPCFVDRVRILRHPGYNVAYWNLMHRTVTREVTGYEVNGQPLVFFHFSGVVPGNRQIFSKHQKRFHPGNIGEVRELLDAYLKELDGNGAASSDRSAYAYDYFADGDPIVPAMRHIFREELEPYDGNPFETSSEVFNEPEPRVPGRDRLLVTRLMYRLWYARNDLRVAFDLRTSEGQEGLARWYLAVAGPEIGVSERFVRPVREALTAFEVQQGGFRNWLAGAPSSSGLSARVLRSLRRYQHWYQYLPQGFRKRVKNVLLRLAGLPRDPLLHESVAVDFGLQASGGGAPTATGTEGAPVHRLDSPGHGAREGVMLVGYAAAYMGVGQGVRMHARALEAVGIDFRIFNVPAAAVYRQDERMYESRFSEVNPYGCAIYHVNADQVPNLPRQVPAETRCGRNIAYWAWELSTFPERWQESFQPFDEIWVPSTFIQRAVSAATTRPVLVMPHAIDRPSSQVGDRLKFAVAEDAFLVLTSFDFNSFMSRKNPGGAIRAFLEAFPDDDKACLLVKTQGGDHHAGRLEELCSLARGDARIRILDQALPTEEWLELQAAADVFLSLHRAEGFGLGLAECMALGKPVIATAYSGNVDFMNVSNSCLVSYQLVPIRAGEYPGSDGQVWAEPDEHHAARHLKRLRQNQALMRRIGERARQDILSSYSPDSIGRRIRERLRIIGALS